MRHNVQGRKLGRTTAHRIAMFRNQLASLVASERITTTLHKAKELRPLAEKVVTHGRQSSLAARRWVRRWIPDRTLVKKLFDEIGPRFKDRPGGYTRIVKIGPRKGDAAEMAVLEFVERGAVAAAPEKGAAVKAPARKAAVKKTAKAAAKKAAAKKGSRKKAAGEAKAAGAGTSGRSGGRGRARKTTTTAASDE
jgi:large subunit ribosomal protein L17